MSRTPWADIKRRFEDPGVKIINGITGQELQPGDMLHINDSHLRLWVVNHRIWLDEQGNYVVPIAEMIHLPEGCPA